jgi:hypothetical protein
MTKVTLNLPSAITVALGKDSGKRQEVETARVAANVWEAIAVAGAKVILTNVFNGGGKDASFDDKAAAVQKKLDAWYRGEFAVIERGDSAMTAMKEACLEYRISQYGETMAQAERHIRDTVKETFGEKESATFGKYLDAVGTALAREQHGKAATAEQVAEARATVEAFYQGLADEAARKRAEIAAKVKAPKLDLSMFKKAD